MLRVFFVCFGFFVPFERNLGPGMECMSWSMVKDVVSSALLIVVHDSVVVLFYLLTCLPYVIAMCSNRVEMVAVF